MADNQALIYEVTLDIAADAAGSFEAWLRAHVREMLALPYFQDARILVPEPAEGAAAAQRWVVQYVARNRSALDDYIKDQAPRMRAKGLKRFGDKMQISRRVLEVGRALTSATALPVVAFLSDAERCRNCGTPLSGKFCPECGQRSHTHVAPLREIAEDFARQQFGFDAKFLHSIVPLLVRPGFLTREYCAGREERYVKPFRLYLFSSLLFFFLAAFMWPQGGNLVDFDDSTQNSRQQTRQQLLATEAKLEREADSPGKQLSLLAIQEQLKDLDKKSAADKTAGSSTTDKHGRQLTQADREQAQLQAKQYLADLDKQPLDARFKQLARAAVQAQLDQLTGEKGQSNKTAKAGADSNGDFNIDLGDDKQPRSGTESRFVDLIKKIKDNQAGFKRQLFANLPKIMLLYLPIVALLLKLFYIRSKRYYVEHFVFTLHVHAMFFVVMLLFMLLAFSARFVPWLGPIAAHAPAVIGWYVTIYLFLALRSFYGQGWFKTSLKFFLLLISYWIAVVITLMADALLTAVEI
jgi:hypothetical protein